MARNRAVGGVQRRVAVQPGQHGIQRTPARGRIAPAAQERNPLAATQQQAGQRQQQKLAALPLGLKAAVGAIGHAGAGIAP